MSLLSRLERVRDKDSALGASADAAGGDNGATEADSEVVTGAESAPSVPTIVPGASSEAALGGVAFPDTHPETGAREGAVFATDPFAQARHGSLGSDRSESVSQTTRAELVRDVAPVEAVLVEDVPEESAREDFNGNVFGGNFLSGTSAELAAVPLMGNSSSGSSRDPMQVMGNSSMPEFASAMPEGETSLAAYSDLDRQARERYRIKYVIFDDVLSALDPRLLQQPQRPIIRQALEKALDGATGTHNISFDRSEREWMLREFVAEVMDFGPITPYLDDPALGKIIINNAEEVQLERLGQIETSPVSFRDDDHLLMLIRRVADLVRGRIDTKVPLLDRPLPGGARVRAKMAPLSSRPALTIEKGSGNPFESLKRQGEGKNAPQPYAQLRERIQQKLLQNLDSRASTANPDQLRAQVEEMINDVIRDERIALTRAERASLITDLINEIIGLGPIEPLLADPEVDEIMVNGPNQIYAERKGKLELTTYRFRDNAHVLQVLDRIVAPLGRRVDEKSPMVDARLRDGSRVNAIISPLALNGPTITIRKFARDPFTMTDLINFGTLTRESAQFLQACVEARLNILISGGTGSGKTTTLNVLSSFIPANERIVTIEDAAELQMRQDHVIRLETRPANIEGAGTVTIRDLVRNALRMRPDRIVVGECRGAEALDMLQAMNTGHDGSLTTGHSNAPRDMLKRLETMVLMSGFDLPVRAIREQIAMAIHLIVHQDRMKDGSRRITYITEISGMEGDVITMQDIFKFEQEYIDDSGKIHGALQATGMRPKNDEAIQRSGVKLPPDLFQPRHLQTVTPMRGRARG
jgi:pilus assembly protein CpaF